MSSGIVYNILPFVNCINESVFNLLTMESVKVQMNIVGFVILTIIYTVQ